MSVFLAPGLSLNPQIRRDHWATRAATGAAKKGHLGWHGVGVREAVDDVALGDARARDVMHLACPGPMRGRGSERGPHCDEFQLVV